MMPRQGKPASLSSTRPGASPGQARRTRQKIDVGNPCILAQTGAHYKHTTRGADIMSAVKQPATCCGTHRAADQDHAPVVDENQGTCTVCDLAAHDFPPGHGYHDARDCSGFTVVAVS